MKRIDWILLAGSLLLAGVAAAVHYWPEDHGKSASAIVAAYSEALAAELDRVAVDTESGSYADVRELRDAIVLSFKAANRKAARELDEVMAKSVGDDISKAPEVLRKIAGGMSDV